MSEHNDQPSTGGLTPEQHERGADFAHRYAGVPYVWPRPYSADARPAEELK